MPLPFLAQLGIAAAPSLISAGANLFRRERGPSPYEEELTRAAQIFNDQASAPLTDNRAYQSGKRQLDQADDRNREAINNRSAATGATDEARLAGIESANQTYADSLNQLLSRAQQYRDVMRDRYLNVIGQGENARLNREYQDDARFQQGLQSIVGPLGKASQAFLMSDVFGGDGGVSPGSTPAARPVGGPASSGSVFNIFDTGGYQGNTGRYAYG